MTMMTILMTMMFDAGMCCWMLDEISCSWMRLDAVDAAADEGDIFALLSYRVMSPGQRNGYPQKRVMFVHVITFHFQLYKGFCLCGFFEKNVLGVTFPT